MKKLIYQSLKLLLLLLISGCDQATNDSLSRQNINDNWQFKQSLDSTWYPATIPSTVHTDLYENKQIPYPFVGDNESQLQWISENGWEYKTRFLVDEKTLQKRNHFLNFEGLDTYASVYLNDSLILKSNNAFRYWKVDVTALLQSENYLKIDFEPTTLIEESEKEKLGYELPEGLRIFSRKAQFQYGWDWGPIFITSGVWRNVYLESWNRAKLEDTYIKQISLTDELAQMEAEIEINIAEETELVLEILVSDRLAVTQKLLLTKGEHLVKIPFEINNPKRWWPHNLGEPHLYDMEVRLRRNNKILDVEKLKKGLRTIEHIAEKDEVGESFYFKVNGEAVFMKGANYIPQNSFQNWVEDSHYEQLLNDAVAANMNMLRVWGGGIYENDVFYEKCDEKGLLVWQDFMFACAMYPGDESFLENVQQEAIDNVKRLRNFTSIALWCGNNEVSEGWHRWGWQEGRSEPEKEEIWNNYLKMFDTILPNTVNKLTEVPYWETSPKFGRGDIRYITEGNAHDWWVWHDGYPFESLVKNVPRFMSEFGFQAFPSYETIKFINDNDSIDINSAAFKTHQKHQISFERIKEYMEHDFPVPDNDEDYVYMSQLLQAYGIGKGIEAHRRARPYNMGSLFWQLNDCWPSVSWSSIDFFGNWKALHYQAKRSFENILVSFETGEKSIGVFVVNDLLENQTGALKLKLLDFYGNELWSENTEISVAKSSSNMYSRIPEEIYKGQEGKVVLEAYFNDTSSLFYFSKPKDLILPQAKLNYQITKVIDGFQIEFTSEVLQKNVFLFSNYEGFFSDNYFDLLPGKSIVVKFETKAKTCEIQHKTFNTFIR
ncbi:beta-mannosidase [Paucihalobacter sp.]|uniref:beta-mannosidase n=1 Tax=Paucihalobacter sp. TaxID=2850405 RepID=UPI003D1620E5